MGLEQSEGSSSDRPENPASALHAGALPPFASLRAFEAVFRTGGIRRAAAFLDLNHAVVSRHIRQLEAWLGGPLLNRSGNRLMLTEQGQRFHDRISAALLEIAFATAEFRGEAERGPVRLWCVPGLSIQWLSGQLAEFERLHPQMRVELKPSDSAPNLLTHEADADIRYVRGDALPELPRPLHAFELARPEIMPVTSPALAGTLQLTSPQSLVGAPLLHEDDQAEWRAWLTLNGASVPQNLPGPLCWHAHLAIASARLGRGIALASRFLIQKDLERGELVEVEVPGARRVALGSYVLVAREDRWSSSGLAELRRFLRERARETSGA